VGIRLSGGQSRATLWNGAAATPLTTIFSVARDINNAGQVAGYEIGEGNVTVATVWSPTGTSKNLGLGAAEAINNNGQVVGFSLSDPNSVGRPTLWSDGAMTFLDSAGFARDINDAGQIVGQGRGAQATLWQAGSAIELQTPTGFSGFPSQINNAGQIVGTVAPGAALWSGAELVELNKLLRPQSVEAGWFLGGGFSINDDGWIVGGAFNRIQCASGSCSQFGFLLTPSDLPDQMVTIPAAIPEPSTYALMLAGLGAIGLWAQRRRAASASR
jgi:probable HAF family extracellular repeat protein